MARTIDWIYALNIEIDLIIASKKAQKTRIFLGHNGPQMRWKGKVSKIMVK